MLEKLEILKSEYYKKYGVKPNALLLGSENYSDLLRNKKAFRNVIILEDFDQLDDLIILQVRKPKMFQVGCVDVKVKSN